jgi:arsenate reductase (thioredoxin)
MNKVIFACVHNAGRSQMAAAWFNALSNPSLARAVSSGTEPGTRVHPEVLEVMREVGIDLAHVKPQLLTASMVGEASHLVTMGCGEACPVAPPSVVRDDWPLEDPKGKPIERVRGIRDEIRGLIANFIRSNGWGSDDATALSFGSAQPSELDEILGLARQCELLEPGIAEALEHFSVARRGNRVVGTCGLEVYDGVGLLRTLAVAPDQRKSGVGRKLVEATLARARNKRLNHVYLLTTTARSYFERLGFTETPRDTAPEAIRGSWEFKSGCPSTATLLRRSG